MVERANHNVTRTDLYLKAKGLRELQSLLGTDCVQSIQSLYNELLNQEIRVAEKRRDDRRAKALLLKEANREA